jgi:hypothetical protein
LEEERRLHARDEPCSPIAAPSASSGATAIPRIVFIALFRHARPLDRAPDRARARRAKHRLYGAYDFDGYPVVETRALSPRATATTCDQTTFVAVGRSSFKLHHRLTKDGVLAVEAFETRVWVVRDPDRPGRLKAQPIPPDVVAKFTAATAPA